MQFAKTERSNGKEVKVGYQKLRIEGKWVRWQSEVGAGKNANF